MNVEGKDKVRLSWKQESERNHRVAGSNPARGAEIKNGAERPLFYFLMRGRYDESHVR